MSEQRSQEDRLVRYLKALGSNYGAFIVNVSIYAITVPLLLEWLGPERYGVWLIFLQLMSFVSIATTWIAAPIAREAAACYVASDVEGTRKLFQTASVYYALLGAAAVLVIILASRFFIYLFKIPPEVRTEAAMALILLSTCIVGLIKLSLLSSILTGFQRMHLANLLVGMPTPLGISLGLAAVAIGFGLTGLAIGHIIAVITLNSFGWPMVHKIEGVTLGFAHFDPGLLHRLLRSGSSYFGYNVSCLLLQSDILLVGTMLGPTVVAVYGIAYKLTDYAIQLIWKIPDSLFPLIAELDIRKGSENLQPVHHLSGKIATAAALLLAIILAIYGRSSLSLWIGPENAVSQKVFIALGMIIVLQVLVHSSLLISYSTNRMGPIARVALAEGGIKVAVAILLLPRIGVLGVALGTIFAQLTLTTWYVPLKACRITGDTLWSYLSKVVVPALPAAIAGGIVGGVVLAVTPVIWLQLLIGIPTSTVIYFVIYLFLGLSVDERQWMVGGLQRTLWVGSRIFK